MTQTLKRCPFCGGMPYFYKIFNHGRYVWKVMCGGMDGKHVDCCNILNEWDTKEQAAKAWNTRSYVD